MVRVPDKVALRFSLPTLTLEESALVEMVGLGGCHLQGGSTWPSLFLAVYLGVP